MIFDGVGEVNELGGGVSVFLLGVVKGKGVGEASRRRMVKDWKGGEVVW